MQDLEKARIMIGQVLRREKLKREIAELQMQAFRAQALPMQVGMEGGKQAACLSKSQPSSPIHPPIRPSC